MLVKDVEDLFKDGEAVVAMTGLNWDLAVNICESGDFLIVRMLLAGAVASRIEIALEDHMLTVSGTREEEALPRDAKYFRKEISGGAFKKSVMLPVAVGRDKVRAEYTNGILKVVMPKQGAVTKIGLRPA